jgi:hypothetical protein
MIRTTELIPAAILVGALGCGGPASPGAGSGSSGAASGSLEAGADATSLMRCALNSDCAAGLVCGLGDCRPQCALDVDCAGGTCIYGFSPGDGAKTTDCPIFMGCASDYRCRNLCATDSDCNLAGMTNKVCAQDVNGVDYCARASDVSVGSMGTRVISAAPPPGAMTGRPVTEPPDASMLPEPWVGDAAGNGG